jgi:hypothetical protein
VRLYDDRSGRFPAFAPAVAGQAPVAGGPHLPPCKHAHLSRCSRRNAPLMNKPLPHGAGGGVAGVTVYWRIWLQLPVLRTPVSGWRGAFPCLGHLDRPRTIPWCRRHKGTRQGSPANRTGSGSMFTFSTLRWIRSSRLRRVARAARPVLAMPATRRRWFELPSSAPVDETGTNVVMVDGHGEPLPPAVLDGRRPYGASPLPDAWWDGGVIPRCVGLVAVPGAKPGAGLTWCCNRVSSHSSWRCGRSRVNLSLN